MNALQLKIFFKQATAGQVTAAWALVEMDLKSGVLASSSAVWSDVFQEAVNLAKQHTGTLGCRSLDILHCAVARILGVNEFVSADSRQKKLAVAMGLNLIGI